MKTLALLAMAAVLAMILVSGCTQNLPQSVPKHCSNGILDGDEDGVDCGGAYCTSCTIPSAINKAAEDKAAAALEGELDQAVANISSSDVEQALLNQ